MRRNIKADIKVFLRNFFDRFENLVPPGFASQCESFEGNRLLLLLFLLLMVRDLNRKIFTIGTFFRFVKETSEIRGFYCCY